MGGEGDGERDGERGVRKGCGERKRETEIPCAAVPAVIVDWHLRHDDTTDVLKFLFAV